MNDLLKKDVPYIWNELQAKSFMEIKDRIASTPVLIKLDYSKDFIIYLFAFEDTIAGVLIQKDKEGDEI